MPFEVTEVGDNDRKRMNFRANYCYLGATEPPIERCPCEPVRECARSTHRSIMDYAPPRCLWLHYECCLCQVRLAPERVRTEPEMSSHHHKEMSSSSRKLFLVWPKPGDSYNRLYSYLAEVEGCKVNLVDNIDTLQGINGASSKHFDVICLAILNPSDKYFTRSNLNALNTFLDAGNKLLLATCARDESNNKFGDGHGDSDRSSAITNLNAFVSSRCGIRFNNNCVIRPNPYELYHPKEAKLEHFVTNRGLNDVLKRYLIDVPRRSMGLFDDKPSSEPKIIYANGCTIRVLDRRKATVMMTSSQWTIPSQQSICTFHTGSNSDQGHESRVVAIGSSAMLTDAYIDREDNRAIVRSLMAFLFDKNFPINISDAKTVEIPEASASSLPDFQRLMDVPVPCLQTTEELPEDKRTLIDQRLFAIDTGELPKVLRAYERLNVPQGPLTLIEPPSLGFGLTSGVSRFVLRRPPAEHLRSSSADTLEST